MRIERGWSQNQLAGRANLPSATVNRIESGKSKGSPKTISALAEALDVSSSELLGEVARPDFGPFEFPVIGAAGATTPREEDGQFVGVAEDPTEKIVLKDCFAIRVVDDSMIPVAFDGQFVLVCGDRPPTSGELVVFSEGKGYLFKRYLYSKNKKLHQFVSINTNEFHDPIIRTKPPRQWFRVVAVIVEKKP